MTTEILRHSVDAHHIVNLGEKSVSDKYQAALELGKNAFDGDAENLTVTLHGQSRTAGEEYVKIFKLSLADDGFGMTFEDIKDKWMRISTDSKVAETESPTKQRRVSGEKGMGRFAMQKLGQKVTVTTTPLMYPGRKTGYPGKKFVIEHDWKRYDHGIMLGDIKTKVTILDAVPGEHGTTIEIEDLNEHWDVMQPLTKEGKTKKPVNDIERLARVLKALVMPKGIFGKEPDFSVKVEGKGFDFEADVETSLSELAPYSVKAVLPAGDNPVATFTLRRRPDVAKKHKQPEEVRDTAPTANAKCGPAKFTVYLFPGRANQWAPSGSPRKSPELTKLLDQECGIKVFNDGVRVMPYGEPGNDMLELNPRYIARRKGKHGGHTRNENIIAYVKLDRKNNPGIIETTTRQKLVDTPEFISLKEDFLLPVITKMETIYQIDKDIEAKAKKTISAGPKADSTLAEIKRLVSSMNILGPEKAELKELANELNKLVKVADGQREEAEDELREKTEVYRAVTTFGLAGLSYEHDIHTAISNISNTLKILNKAKTKAKLGEDARHIDDAIDYVQAALEWSKYSMEIVGQASAVKKRTKMQVDMEQELERLGRQYAPLHQLHQLEFDYNVRGNIPGIFISKANLLSILNNLMTNSMKALAGVARSKKQISVTVEKTSSNLKIEWKDNGTGIAEDDREYIFEMLWTRRSNKYNLSLGLGLSIVQEIMEDLDGKIEVKETVDDNKEPGKGRTTFTILIPLRSLEKNG